MKISRPQFHKDPLRKYAFIVTIIWLAVVGSILFSLVGLNDA